MAAEQMPLAPAHDAAFYELRKREEVAEQDTKERRLFQSSTDLDVCAAVHSSARRPHMDELGGRTTVMKVLAAHDRHGL